MMKSFSQLSNSTFWDSLSSRFQEWLSRNIKDAKVRLSKSSTDPKLRGLIATIKQKLQHEIGRIDKKYPDLANSAERLTATLVEYGVEEQVWPGDAGQNFVEGMDEIVLAIHLPQSLYVEYSKDPTMRKFLNIHSAHFDSIRSPLGWALVHKTEVNEEPAIVINQIQSDILPRFHRVEHSMTPSQPITEEEVRERLIANNRRGFANNVDIVRLLAQHPDQIEELPNLTDANQAQNWIQRHQEEVQNLVELGLLNPEAIQGDEDELSPQEMKYIREKLSTLVQEWPAIVYEAVKQKAKELGIRKVYMNTSETVSGGSHKKKREYFYETLPSQWGFKKERVHLPGRKQEEELWHKLESSLKKLRKVLASRRAIRRAIRRATLKKKLIRRD